MKTSQAHHGRCHIRTPWAKEVTMAAQGGQILTNLLFCSWNQCMCSGKELYEFSYINRSTYLWIHLFKDDSAKTEKRPYLEVIFKFKLKLLTICLWLGLVYGQQTNFMSAGLLTLGLLHAEKYCNNSYCISLWQHFNLNWISDCEKAPDLAVWCGTSLCVAP